MGTLAMKPLTRFQQPQADDPHQNRDETEQHAGSQDVSEGIEPVPEHEFQREEDCNDNGQQQDCREFLIWAHLMAFTGDVDGQQDEDGAACHTGRDRHDRDAVEPDPLILGIDDGGDHQGNGTDGLARRSAER